MLRFLNSSPKRMRTKRRLAAAICSALPITNGAGGVTWASQLKRAEQADCCYSRRFPFADSLINLFRRAIRVSSFLALTIHQPIIFRYDGGCVWKKFHAVLFFFSNFAYGSLNSVLRCSYE